MLFICWSLAIPYGLLNCGNSAEQMRGSHERLQFAGRSVRNDRLVVSGTRPPNALPPNFQLPSLPHFQPSLALMKLKRGSGSVMSPRVRPKGCFNPSHRSQLCCGRMRRLPSELLWIEVSTVWHMPLALADLQLRDPGLNSGDGEALSKSERKFSHQRTVL